MNIRDIETPALLIDLDALNKNLDAMALKTKCGSTHLRPHFKSAKITEIARMQMDRGARGITCAKLSEAEVVAKAGINDILIANEIVNPGKINRLAHLAQSVRLTVAADDEVNLVHLSEAALRFGAEIGILIELDVGMDRCGVWDEHALLRLAKRTVELPGLRFEGIQAYEGHLIHIESIEACQAGYQKVTRKLTDTLKLLRENGIPAKEVSGGGTGTHELALKSRLLTELQAGSYIYMDASYRRLEGMEDFQSSLFLLTEIIGHTNAAAIGDVGTKTTGIEFGSPILIGDESAPLKLSEEHVKIPDASDRYARGDRLKILPSHSCTTINLFDVAYGVIGDEVERIFCVDGRGKSQ